ncbi:hypothetical protein [Aldersonia kunmingensis]|uniref:hypothetical protein n=1 Tax=Aldersonia kunmingensis TaxID=408066 RepID=UPI000B2D9E18|nr:hypothetical protein [Aldersonia kunmingensis]
MIIALIVAAIAALGIGVGIAAPPPPPPPAPPPAVVAPASAPIGTAGAYALAPDYGQPANGAGTAPALTPAFSPVQVPPVQVEGGTVLAHPYLASWVHDLVQVPPGTALEARGAVRVRAGDVVVNPNGHCLFGEAAPAAAESPLTPVRVSVPGFELVVEPTLYR